jgi:hypothetical protein
MVNTVSRCREHEQSNLDRLELNRVKQLPSDYFLKLLAPVLLLENSRSIFKNSLLAYLLIVQTLTLYFEALLSNHPRLSERDSDAVFIISPLHLISFISNC